MNFSILLLLLILKNTSGVQVLSDNVTKYCFKFTWPGSNIDETKINCTAKENMNIPCVSPIEVSLTPPNLTDIWLKKKDNFTCSLQKGYSCVKYTYSFNDAISNTTYFCGRMIDKEMNSGIEDGCYSKNIGGYSVEACACQSTGFGNGMPCNSSIKHSYSSVLLLVLLLPYLVQKQL